ncbi:MAG: T9SS type A sorting domain-containing protein [Candidatus Poribacteria bacterium]|nr:T9SS type A sorting domain-containing protein [Candidatus Poribacteria bacterium]
MKNSSTLIAGFSIIVLTLLSVTPGYTNPRAVGTLRYSVLAEQPESVLSVAFNPIHEDILAVGRADGTIRLWNTSTPELLHTLGGRTGTVKGHTDVIFTLAFSPDGNKLASGSADGTVRVWNTTDIENQKSIKELWKFSEHNGLVLTLAFLTENGNALASGSKNGSIRFWNIETGEWQDVISGDAPAVLSLASSPKNNLLATGRSDKIIRVWNLTDSELMHTFDGHKDDVTSLAFNSDGNMLVSGSADGTVQLWSISPDASPQEFTPHTDWVNSVALHQTTLASGSHNGTIFLWDVKNTKKPLHILTGHADSVESIAFSPDGETLVGGGHDGKVLLWNLMSSQIREDLNSDGFVNRLDLAIVDSLLGTRGHNRADVSGNNIVDIADLVLVANAIEATAADRNALVSERADVDDDGDVDMEDLVAVDKFLGMMGQYREDVNIDGVVNIVDLVLVANAIGPAAAAPALRNRVITLITAEKIKRWLTEAQLLGEISPAYQRGVLVLEQLLATLTPKTTVLLPNYPNPFNPETWIPYRLAEPADVTVTIYAASGMLVRTLQVGHQPAGIYQSRAQAAYWDGKNEFGEPVASSLYFYTLTTGEFTATRKMLIRK